MHSLRERFHHNPAIRVFYQVSTRPLFTVNGDHYISELIDVCGGRNVFAELNELAPAVAVEAVIGRDPEVLMAGSDAGDSALEVWDRWPRIAANRYGNRFRMPSAEIGRATPRLVDAGGALCAALQTARERRAATGLHDASG
jgi:iron complex transport system substrate-binding protein